MKQRQSLVMMQKESSTINMVLISSVNIIKILADNILDQISKIWILVMYSKCSSAEDLAVEVADTGKAEAGICGMILKSHSKKLQLVLKSLSLLKNLNYAKIAMEKAAKIMKNAMIAMELESKE